MLKPESPIDVQIICHSWTADLEKDTLDATVTVRIFVHAGGSTGKHLDYTCHTPEELWHFLRELTVDPLGMLDLHFDYKLPVFSEPSQPLPMDLKELFND